jgi:PEP-CTERM motif
MSNRFGTAIGRSATACMVAGLVQAGSALATLQLRDINGSPTTNSSDAVFAYDTVLDATWYLTGTDLRFTWDQVHSAVSWAAGLTVGSFSGWMLPATDTTCRVDSDGPLYNCTGSQMGELWYTELGNPAGGPMSNTGPFKNLKSDLYWSGTEYAPNSGWAWAFNTFGGSQDPYTKDTGLYALAVRPGDVAAVPEPATVLLIGVGMLGLVCTRSRRRRSSFSHSDDRI